MHFGRMLNSFTLALVVYDYALTIHEEVELIWKRRISCASFLFISNRYILLSYTVIQFIFPSTDKVCGVQQQLFTQPTIHCGMIHRGMSHWYFPTHRVSLMVVSPLFSCAIWEDFYNIVVSIQIFILAGVLLDVCLS